MLSKDPRWAHIQDIDLGTRQAGEITQASSQEATRNSAVIRETANRIGSLATRIIELSDNGVTDFSGTYDDYLRSQGIIV